MKPLLLVSLLACASVPAGPTSVVPEDPLGFPAASGDLVLPPPSADPRDEGMTLQALVAEYARLTGLAVTYSSETEQFLANTYVRVLGGMTVPADRVQATFEALLVVHDFVLTPVLLRRPQLVEITSLQTGGRNTVRKDAVYIEADQIEAMTGHPAVLCTTVVHLENTDVRQLSNAMRTMITDANTQQMLPAGNTNSMILVGLGPSVATMARMLRSIDAAAPQPAPRTVEAKQGEGGGD